MSRVGQGAKRKRGRLSNYDVKYTAMSGSDVKKTIQADTCSDDKIVYASLLSKLADAVAVSKVNYLNPPRILHTAVALPNGKQVEIKCRRVAA